MLLNMYGISSLLGPVVTPLLLLLPRYLTRKELFPRETIFVERSDSTAASYS